MVRVGIVGIGFMGMIHYLAYQKVRGVKVVALCTRNRKRLAGDWRSIQGNFGPPGRKMDLGKIARYEDLHDMLADPNVDVVDICLPTWLHTDYTIESLKAGKHVLCEKPIALTTRDANRMLKAAATADRQLFIGHVLPFFPEFEYVHRLVESRKYGRLLGGQFRRVISDPLWLKSYYDPDRIGGPMLDLHIHDAHFIRLLCGMPQSVNSVGRMRGKVAEYFTSQFGFKDKRLSVSAICGTLRQQGREFNHGYEVHLEKATVLFDFSVLDNKPVVVTPVTVLDNRDRVLCPSLGSGDPIDSFAAELRHVVGAVRSGKQSTILSGQLARDALVMCQNQSRSIESGRTARIGRK